MKKRFYYELRTKRYACISVLISEIERMALALGPDGHVASTYIYTDRCVDPATLESEETAVIRHDRLAEKRTYLRSIIEYYGHDKATLSSSGRRGAGEGLSRAGEVREVEATVA